MSVLSFEVRMKPSTYCKNCGAYIPDGKKKCLACGFPVDVPLLYTEGDENKVETTTFQECSPNRLSFKPIDGYTEQRRFSWNGYEINENGQVLSIPDDDEISMTTFTDKTIQLEKARDKYAKIVFSDDYYERTLNLANEALEEIKKLEPKKQEPKPDIDLDDLMEKTFVTVKINDKVTRFYFDDRPQMRYDADILGHTLDGRPNAIAIKRKIYFRLIET